MHNYLSDAVPEMGIKGSSGEDDLREHCGVSDGVQEIETIAVRGDAVHGLRPPLVGGDVEAGDGDGGADEVLDFLVER